MAKTEDLVEDQERASDDQPIVVRSRPGARKILLALAVLAAGAALFAGGMFVANQTGSDDEAAAVTEAADSLALQQAVPLMTAADEIISAAQGADPAADLTSQGVQLQRYAVTLEAVASQIGNPELRDTMETLSEGYLNVSVGLITNSGQRTTAGAEQLNDGRDRLVEILGIADEQAPATGDGPAEEQAPAPEPAGG